ncbi:glycosyltransferase family 4 protein [Streptococcus sp. NLN64]|uniref:glycosyltransferase family 4 protein n=1 Tax=Streptococcus sp. NLN64 TaxID=2822799 RepID=UPI0018CBC867|nr:glycosyltransferase family 4 protein [Streptococcus sp. NLN64]MBG9368050.1 glycosyltransferase family 4 protein [Streptococcus sp. NLN64]
MRIGLFTDTYFPQVSGVATSIRTLREELEEQGHDVFIFTTTDRNVDPAEENRIIRIPSVPFFAFKDRRVAYRGFSKALALAKEHRLELIHTQTEFALGFLGLWIARELEIPVIHTYHTQYEDYVHYIAKGMLIRPGMIKYMVRSFLDEVDGVVCPSEIVYNLLVGYRVEPEKRVIPTGIELDRFIQVQDQEEAIQDLRKSLALSPDTKILLSLSRVSFEKNIQAIIRALPEVLNENDAVRLIVAGDGPYLENLKSLAKEMAVEHRVLFVGMVPPEQTVLYYRMADFFVSASTSETQGLTFLESLASGTPVIAQSNPYLDNLVSDKMFGTLYQEPEDLSGAILEALLATPYPQEKKWQEKLFEISAENFGLQVYQYYLDISIRKGYLKGQGMGDPRPRVRFARSLASFPLKVVALPVQGSRRVIRISRQQVKRLPYPGRRKS